ncbi:MAG: M28 family metallopeptidase [Bacteroidales bacterium]
MKIRNFFLLYLFFLHAVVSSQDVEYAGKIIETLSSPAFHGRGYVNKGLEVSAGYIQKEFENTGLQPLFEGYSQWFNMPVNTFPGKLSLCLDSICMQPGIEFLADPASPALSGTYEFITIARSTLFRQRKLNKKLTEAAGKFIVIDQPENENNPGYDAEHINQLIKILKYDPRLQIAGVIELTDKKLSWNVSTGLAPRPSFLVKTASWPFGAESVKLELENRFFNEYPASNLAGFVQGTLIPDSFLLITAHYDHLGRMGNDCYFPGANDNASGVAVLLDLAKYYAKNKPDYSIIFVAFAGEEAGLLGSDYFVKNTPIDLKKIKFLINLDLAGNGEDGLAVVNGSVHTGQFRKIAEINHASGYFPMVKARGEACNSDHCPFHKAEVPCFFIYTMGGTGAYHDLNDDYSSLSLSRYDALFNLITAFIGSF